MKKYQKIYCFNVGHIQSQIASNEPFYVHIVSYQNLFQVVIEKWLN